MIRRQAKYTRFSMLFLLISMASVVIGIVIVLALGIGFPGGVIAFVVPMASGMIVGQWQYEETGVVPEGRELWIDALRYAAIGLGVTFLMAVPGFLAPSNADILSDIGVLGFVAITGVLFVVCLLAVRLGLGLGMKAGKNK